MATIPVTRKFKTPKAAVPVVREPMAKMSEDDVKRLSFVLAMREAIYEPEEPPKPKVEEPLVVPSLEDKIAMLLAKEQMTTKKMALILHKRKSTLNPILYSNKRFKIVGKDGEAPIWGNAV